MAEACHAAVGFFLLATSWPVIFWVCLCIVCFRVLMNSILTARITKIGGCTFYLGGAKFQGWGSIDPKGSIG